ncbi:MAG TPA: alpha-amylase family protein [Chloroflexota bacterium]|nr:alpha-amylase family protein [Chloroflexota bacterium]
MVLNDLWYKNAVIYCIDVATFFDGNGDGIGDFKGLAARLDYLAGMGITCIWLLPFYPSPRRDDGYDVADYYGVDPRFGTLGEFVEFVSQARQRGIRVIVDLVMNHTSDQHPWFLDARRSKRSPHRDWYVWSPEKPKDAEKGVVFPGVQKTTWTFDKQAGEWYFHRFFDFQPDLNTENPAVQAEFRRVMGFWLELGVSGFRVDALPFVISNKGAGRPPGQRWQMLRDMRLFLQWHTADAILLAEANVLPEEDLEYFGDRDDRMHMLFNFQVNQHLFYALATADGSTLSQALERTRTRPETAQWANFLRNNDELDLGRLVAEQREKVLSAFAPEDTMRLYGRGIRRRLAPMMGADRRRMELAYSLMFTLPGTPVLRYGDEIGMGDDLKLPDRDCGRTPMQWAAEEHAGFSGSKTIFRPVIREGPFGYPKVNMAGQRRDPESLLNWMERIIRMYKECPEFSWGDWKQLDTGIDSVLALQYSQDGGAVLAVHNLSESPVRTSIEVDHPSGQRLFNLLSNDHSISRSTRHALRLEPHAYRWFRVGSEVSGR